MQATNGASFLQIEEDLSFDQKMKDGGWRKSGELSKYQIEVPERRDTYGSIQQRRLLSNSSGASAAFEN